MFLTDPKLDASERVVARTGGSRGIMVKACYHSRRGIGLLMTLRESCPSSSDDDYSLVERTVQVFAVEAKGEEWEIRDPSSRDPAWRHSKPGSVEVAEEIIGRREKASDYEFGTVAQLFGRWPVLEGLDFRRYGFKRRRDIQ